MMLRFALLLLASIGAMPLHARQCPSDTVQDRLDAADWVFVGEIAHRGADIVRMQVLRTIKGPTDRVAHIVADQRGALALPALVDRPMLVFAQRRGGDWTAGACSGTGTVQRQDERLVALGFTESDFAALGLPSDASLMQRLAVEFEAYREAVLVCPDARCYQALQGNADTAPATVAYYEREFPAERALHAALDAARSHRLIGGGVGATGAYLRYALSPTYHPPHETGYDGFEVDFAHRGNDRWTIQAARPRRLAELIPVRDGHRAWTNER